jgi:hypothetical protein
LHAIFIQKILNFLCTCGLVSASRSTNFYKIPIFGYIVMPQKHFFLSCGQLQAAKKKFILKLFWVGFFLINS